MIRTPPSLPLLLAITACHSGGTTSTTGSGGAGTTSTSVKGASVSSGATSTATGTGGAGPTCGSGAWATYAHDGQRTSASDGCTIGPLTPLWTYTPTAPSGKMVAHVFQALATSSAAYFHWSATDPPYTGTTAADGVGLDGKRLWTFDSGTDTDLGDWGSLWQDKLALQSDGVYVLDQATGTKAASSGVDWWGQTIPSSTALYLVDTSKSDGPGLFVAALDMTAKAVWKANVQGTMCGQGFADQTGGIALDGTTLFYAPNYATGSMTQPMFASGVYAFDTTQAGMLVWKMATTPVSAVSASGGFVFLIENNAGADKLVARKAGDGSVAWSVPAPNGIGVQAPALADGKVIVGSATNVVAFDQMTGVQAWSAPVPAPTFANDTPISNGCGGLQPLANLPTTALAVASGNGSVVVVDGKTVTLLSLKTGATTWTGTVAVTGSLASPVIVGDRVYVTDTGGTLIALQSSPT